MGRSRMERGLAEHKRWIENGRGGGGGGRIIIIRNLTNDRRDSTLHLPVDGTEIENLRSLI